MVAAAGHPVLPERPGPLPALDSSHRLLPGWAPWSRRAAGCFSELSRGRARPGSQAWFPFAESSFPQTAPHPPHPGPCPPPCPGSSGLSLRVPPPAPPQRRPRPLRLPEPQSPRGSPPSRHPWGRGPSTGSTSGRVAEPLASCLLPAPLPEALSLPTRWMLPSASAGAQARSAHPSQLRPRVGMRPGAEVTGGAVGSASPALACPLLGVGDKSSGRLVLGRPGEQGTR